MTNARRGKVGRATRYSPVDGATVRYVAVQAPGDSVVRLGVPIGEIEARLGKLQDDSPGQAYGLALALSMQKKYPQAEAALAQAVRRRESSRRSGTGWSSSRKWGS